MICRRCGQDKEPDEKDPHLCVDCAKAERNRYSYLRKNQGDWMEVAKEADIPVWLQQPGETQLEYTIWSIYRDSYPGRRLSYREVAEKAATTHGFVGTAAQRWTFQARMQAWMAECDRITMDQRRQEILEMNKDHVDMARRLRNKMSQAIDAIDPNIVKPSEISSLMKVATDLERKAQIDSQAQEEMMLDHSQGEQASLKSPTKQSDLGEVINILMNAGALGTVTQIGIKETREVVAVDSSGNRSSILQED